MRFLFFRRTLFRERTAEKTTVEDTSGRHKIVNTSSMKKCCGCCGMKTDEEEDGVLQWLKGSGRSPSKSVIPLCKWLSKTLGRSEILGFAVEVR
jgi:hypothetical protein